MKNIIIDEWPEVLDQFSIALADIPTALDSTGAAWRKAVEPWAKALMAGTDDLSARARACEVPEIPDSFKIPGFESSGGFNAKLIALSFAPVKVAGDVRRAAHESSKLTFSEGRVDVVRLSTAAAHLKSQGGTILAAGLPRLILQALRPDVIYRQHNVEDSPGVAIERVRVLVSQASTSALAQDPERLRAICDDVYRRRPGSRVFVCCPKKLTHKVKEYAETFEVSHFGAIEGLDTWQGCDVFATIGDHYQNLLSVDIEAEFFGVDANELGRQKLACELEQAHGRARDCRRTKPALHLHYGLAWPGRWYSSNTLTENFRAI